MTIPVTPQRENKAQVAKDNASAAVSVPELRAEVVRLAEAVQILEAQIERLISRVG